MRYLKLIIKNIQPLSISDASTSYSGQSSCFRYIPGSTIRGYVISKIASDSVKFSTYKSTLFSSKIRFLNGYPTDDGIELIPTLKGFYEDKKAAGPIQNVVIKGKFDEGMKRASLGRFCAVKGDLLKYYNIETSSNMKIQISGEGQKVFRGEYILPGYTFVSYVAVDQDVDDEILQLIEDVFKNGDAFLGNGRSQGFGRCIIEVKATDRPLQIECTSSGDANGHVYMALLSHTVMRGEDGEYCGLNLSELEKILGVRNLEIEHCATTVIDIHGYNITWRSKLPSVPMYEQGSVFRFKFDGTIHKEKMQKLTDEGLGERLNEGFGRVVFLGDEYEMVKEKEKGEVEINRRLREEVCSEEDCQVIEKIAKRYYRTLLMNAMQKQIPLKKSEMRMKKSQVGTVLSILEKNRYNDSVDETINRYFAHAKEKQDRQKVQKETLDISGFSRAVTDILNNADSIQKTLGVDKEEIMGIKVDKLMTPMEKKQLAVAYAIELIKYARKED